MEEKIIIDADIESTTEVVAERGPWKFFAKAGRICGVVSLATFWFYFGVIGLEIGIFGIILSALGKKSKIRNDEAKRGLKLSIIGTSLSFASLMTLILIYVVIVILGVTGVIPSDDTTYEMVRNLINM